MKCKILSLALALLLTPVPAAVPAQAAAFTPVTGWDMLKELGLGINIGNTLEARTGLTDEPLDNHMNTETLWGAAKIEQWHFKAIAMKGFGNVRIPVSWEPHMDKDYKINKEWMDRVQQCVDWALEEGLIVTLNTHHESGFYEFMGSDGKGDYEAAKKWLTAVWTQIAERFKDYPETLIFEPMNEPRPGADGWFWDYVNYPAQKEGMKNLVDFTNRLNHDILAHIRGTGGNNDKRIVLLTLPQADANLIDRYKAPDDPYTMLGVFFYPGREKEQIAQIKAGLNEKIPIVIKETNPLEIKEASEALDWAKTYYGELAKTDAAPIWWNCGGTGVEELLNRHLGEWNKPMTDAFFAAYGAVPGGDYPPPPPKLPHTLDGPYKDSAFTYWTPPVREMGLAGKMVVEYEGVFTGGYMFTRIDPTPWVQFANGDSRITEEPGKLTFDLRGLEGKILGFAAWGEGNAAKIKHIYIDRWEGSSPSLSNFTKIQTYNNNFTDIANHYAKDWIIKAYDYGIIAGSGNTYGTTNNMTIQDALVIASKMHGIYNNGAYDYNSHGAYPDGYISYALDNGLTDDRFEGKYTRPATRGELAYIWGNILPKEELQKLNDYVPFSDVPAGHTYYDEIKLFYEAGIVTGSGGSFNPDSNVIRGDCAVMFVRLVSLTDRSGYKG